MHRSPKRPYSAIMICVLLAGASALSVRSAHAQEETRMAAESRVVLITGSTDGLGRNLAIELAAPGTHILVHGRNEARGQEVVDAIEAEGGTARFYRADLAELAEVRDLAAHITADVDRLDVLVNNAGIWLPTEQGRQVNPAGHELHFAINYLSHYLLTRRLLPLLTSTPGARIVNVSSGAQVPIDFDDVMLEDGYSDMRAYAQSKLAQVLFTVDLAAELEPAGVRVNALHPATMMNTMMVLSRGAPTRSTVEEGVAAIMHLITSPEVGTGGYYNGTRPARADPQAYDAEARARLRTLSEQLTAAP